MNSRATTTKVGDSLKGSLQMISCPTFRLWCGATSTASLRSWHSENGDAVADFIAPYRQLGPFWNVPMMLLLGWPRRSGAWSVLYR